MTQPHDDAGLLFAKDSENRRYRNWQFRREQDIR
jgi:hypothetical protein